MAIADVPQAIRGFGHVKARHLAAARETRERLIERFHAPDAAASAKGRAVESAV